MGLPFEDVIEAGPSGCHMTEDGVFFNPLDHGEPHCLPHRRHLLASDTTCTVGSSGMQRGATHSS
jgi:hypothetical protein